MRTKIIVIVGLVLIAFTAAAAGFLLGQNQYNKDANMEAMLLMMDGGCYKEANDPWRAIAYYNRAAGIMPGWYYPFVEMAKQYEVLGQYELALEAVGEAIESYEFGISPYGKEPAEYREMEKERLRTWRAELEERLKEHADSAESPAMEVAR